MSDGDWDTPAGTIDKLESIDGFRTELSKEEFINNLNMHKMAIVGQAENLTPADKKYMPLGMLRALLTVFPYCKLNNEQKDSFGCDRIVLDVKVGSGAFMKSVDDAVVLARRWWILENPLEERPLLLLPI